MIPLTDVLDADRQLLLPQDDLAQNQADAARAAVHAYRALGGGWSPATASAKPAVFCGGLRTLRGNGDS